MTKKRLGIDLLSKQPSAASRVNPNILQVEPIHGFSVSPQFAQSLRVRTSLLSRTWLSHALQSVVSYETPATFHIFWEVGRQTERIANNRATAAHVRAATVSSRAHIVAMFKAESVKPYFFRNASKLHSGPSWSFDAGPA